MLHRCDLILAEQQSGDGNETFSVIFRENGELYMIVRPECEVQVKYDQRTFRRNEFAWMLGLKRSVEVKVNKLKFCLAQAWERSATV